MGWTRTERETDTDFAHAFERGVSEKTIQTDGRERERESSENGEEKAEQTLCAPRLLDAIGHRANIEERQRRIDRTDRIPNRTLQRH